MPEKWTPRQRELAEELLRRKRAERAAPPAAPEAIPTPAERAAQLAPGMAAVRQEAMAELAEEVGPLEAFLVGAGRGLTTIGRGVGLVPPADPTERAAMEALAARRPYTTAAGEIVGEAAPFLPAAVATGGIAGLIPRAAAAGGVGALEAAAIAKGRDEDIIRAAGVGAGIGFGAEVLFPIVGRLGRKIFQRITGRVPKGSMLDAAGKPTPELQEALDKASMNFEDLTQDAADIIGRQRPGAVAEQVARKARFAEEEIPITRGELTREFPQLFKEYRLYESAADVAAEPFRQFKLKQSEAIKDRLTETIGTELAEEETGGLIKDALVGRRRILRAEKNDLYKIASDTAKEAGGVPIFTDNISDALVDPDMFEDLAITAPAAMESLDRILVKYGIKEPSVEALRVGFKPTPLTIDNFERFRKTLNRIDRADTTGAASVAIRPVIDALDTELDELGAVAGKNIPKAVVQPLKEARKRVRQIKVEFSPQVLVGRLVDTKKDGVTEIIESSKVYDKLVARSTPIEDIRKTVQSLTAAGAEGANALGALQTSTIMDLISAGFGTESRKISGIKVFNPTAFKKRVGTIGNDKLKSIFTNNPEALRKIKNIDAISADLIPEAGAMPKGSSSSLLDLATNFLATKIPFGNMTISALKAAVGPIPTGMAARRAMTPEVQATRELIMNNFPGAASALGIAAITEGEEPETGEIIQ